VAEQSKIEWVNRLRADGTAIEGGTFNPWLGCEKVSPACANCLAPDTPILYADMSWRPIGDAKAGDILAAFDEHTPRGESGRKLRPAVVEHVWWSNKPTSRLVTSKGEITTTPDHRWLRHGSQHWVKTSGLLGRRNTNPNDGVRFLFEAGVPLPVGDDYRAGYIAGMTLGDGTFRFHPGQRSDKMGFPQAYWRVALADPEPLGRLVAYLSSFGVEVATRPFDSGSLLTKLPMQKVEVRSLGKLAVIHRLVTEEREAVEWRRGFLAGFFDAEGSYHQWNLRVSQNDVSVLERVVRHAAACGFRFVIEKVRRCTSARLAGTLRDRMRFFFDCRPAIARKQGAMWGNLIETDCATVEAVEAGPSADVVDIQTSTATFVAAGILTHNCYAERDADHRRHVVKWGGESVGGTRRMTSPEYWKRPLGIADRAYKRGERVLMFTASWADVFEDWRGPILNSKDQVLYSSLDGLTFSAKQSPGWRPVTMYQLRVRLLELMARTAHGIDWLVLTKRSREMRDVWAGFTNKYRTELNSFGDLKYNAAREYMRVTKKMPNVWVGVTVESQEWAEKRLWDFLHVPAARHFVSAEPLFGPLNLRRVRLTAENGGVPDRQRFDALTGNFYTDDTVTHLIPKLDWVITGGESGPKARPAHSDWYRRLRDDARDTGCDFLFKQFGELLPIDQSYPHHGNPAHVNVWADGNVYPAVEVRGGRAPLPMACLNVGRASAGRELDGKVWHEIPASVI
jgi:protein gp37